MANKKKMTAFYCSECGCESAKWVGQCPACHQWNTMVEVPVHSTSPAESVAGAVSLLGDRPRPRRLSEVEDASEIRWDCGYAELNRVLGGGIVKGSLILVGGDPGIGKSTLLLQVTAHMSAAGLNVLYVSGEESLRQIKLRASRIGAADGNMRFLCETDLDYITEVLLTEKPDLCVIDSIQTMAGSGAQASPGSVSQVRETTAVLMKLAKQTGITFFIIGHVTKEGTVAGPRVLEHMVDTVLFFEGDRYASYRIIRGIKNRFGSTNEIGVFEMTGSGLREVPNPSEYMLEGRPENASGSVVACSMEGTRPILVEVQALVTPSTLAYPRRTADGADVNRVNLLLAVLEKRLGMRFSAQDVYVNIAGGIRMREPSVDLGIVLALISSFKDILIDEKTVVFGEVGLSGEVRAVSMAAQRVLEAKKLGYERVILPASSLRGIKKTEGIRLDGVRSVRDIFSVLKGS